MRNKTSKTWKKASTREFRFEGEVKTHVGMIKTAPAWGDQMVHETERFRIVYQNVNGLNINEEYSTCLEIGDAARERQVDLLGLSETCADWSYEGARDKCHKMFQNTFDKQLRMSVSSSDDTNNSRFQPGGTATVLGGNWVGRATVHSDNSGMGRWSEIRLTGKNNTAVRMITAYRVCDEKFETAGPTTAFMQQHNIMFRQGIMRPDPRAAILNDLGKHISKAREEGDEVIIMIDANEWIGKKSSKLANWANKHEMMEVLTLRHGTEDEPATHVGGSKRIDYVFMSAKIAEYVEHTGILEEYDFYASDHRAIFVDIDMENFLGSKPSALEQNSNRGLSSSDPRAVQTYCKLLKNKLEERKVQEELAELQDDIERTGTFTLQHAEKLNALDEAFTEMKIECEKGCRGVRSSPWSPKLRDARNLVRYWKSWMTQLRRNVDLSEKRDKEWIKTKVELAKITKKYVQVQLKDAQKKLRATINNATDLRKDHLRDRATTAGNDGATNTEKAINNMARAEEQTEAYKRLRRLMGRGIKSGLSHILVEGIDGEITSINDPAEINKRIIARNKEHFSQADGTPFTTSPLTDILGKYGTNQASQWLLEGKMDRDIERMGLAEATVAILKKLRHSDNKFSDHISSEELTNGYKKWRESTSTSPSGLHLGHEKALFKHEKGKGEEEISLLSKMMDIKATLLNLAITHGHVYRRWHKIVNATIEKIPGKPLLHKLRVIHLIESDFNLMIGILWGRRMIANGEMLDSFGEEQAGSRKDHSAQEVLVIKQSMYSILRMTRTNGTSFDNDAKSCFDRIVMLVASLCAQKEGMSKRASELFLKTLERVRYHVKTNLGISEESYATSEESTVHGPGQGGRGSPGIWVIISCIIMECLQGKSNGLEVSTPDKENTVNIRSTGFVDDVTLWTGNTIRSLETMETYISILREMGIAAQWWEQLLYTTGGKLELTKCFFYLIYWVFNKDGTVRMMEPDEIQRNIEIKDSETGKTVRIETKSCHEAHKTLGCMESPDGNYKQETKRLQEKANEFVRRLNGAKIHNNDAWLLYFTMMKPGLLYSAPAGTLSKIEADGITSTMNQSILNSMGYCKSTPTAVVQGPKLLGGIGLCNMFVEQTAAKALFTIRHVRANKRLGKLLVTRLQWAQVVAGVEKPILEDTGVWLPHLDDEKWIQTLREGLHMAGCSIDIPTIDTIKRKREKDRVLMDLVESDKAYNPSEHTMRKINMCRVYLRAETLADICDASGKCINDSALECKAFDRGRETARWPRQERPGKNIRKAWSEFLKRHCKDGTLVLLEPLGPWKDIEMIPNKNWSHSVNIREKRMYTYMGNGTYRSREIREKHRKGWRVSEEYTVSTTSSQGRLPVTQWISAGKYYISDPGEFIKPTKPVLQEEETDQTITEEEQTISSGSSTESESTASDSSCSRYGARSGAGEFETMLETCHYYQQDLMTGVTLKNNAEKERLMDKLNEKEGTIIIVSDGGVRNGIGGYGWIITTETMEILWRHKGRARGEDINSYRAEAYGMLSWITFLLKFQDFTGVKIRCKIKPYCDNKALIGEAEWGKSNRVGECLKPEYDMITAIREDGRELARVAEGLMMPEHVKGHVDTHTAWLDMSPQEKGNYMADELATEAIKDTKKKDKSLRVKTMPACTAYLRCDKNIVTRGEAKILMNRWVESELQRYLCERQKIKSKTLHEVNWAGNRLARENLTTTERKFATKLQIGWLATGRRTKLYGGEEDKCHRCGLVEDNDHIIKCPKAKRKREDTRVRFSKYLGEIHTCHEVNNALTQGMESWMENKEPTRNDETQIQSAIETQKRIGWSMFMRGWLTKEWARYQEENTKDEGKSAQMGDVWSSKVSRWLIREFMGRWKERNEEANEAQVKADGSTTNKANEEANAKARRIYERRLEVGEMDRGLFDVPIETRLQWNCKSKMKWWKSTTTWLNVRKKVHEDRMARGQMDIRIAFKRVQDELTQRARGDTRPDQNKYITHEETAVTVERTAKGDSEVNQERAWGSLRRPKVDRSSNRKKTSVTQNESQVRKSNPEKPTQIDKVGSGRKPRIRTQERVELNEE